MLVNVGGKEGEPGQREAVGVEERLLGVLAVLGVDDLLVDAHAGRHEEGKGQHANPDGKRQPVDVFEVVPAPTAIARHDGADGDAGADADDRNVFGQRVPFLQQDDAQDHVGNKRARAARANNLIPPELLHIRFSFKDTEAEQDVLLRKIP